MSATKINKRFYYQFGDLLNNYPELLKGCKTAKSFIVNNNLDKKNYIYARQIGGKWTQSDGTSKKVDKMFVLKKWFKANFIDADDTDTIDDTDDTSNKVVKIAEVIPDAPNFIELKSNEKFVDNDGNECDIEIRGKRKSDKCYFRAKDIIGMFGITKLNDMITNTTNNYVDNEYCFYFGFAKKSGTGMTKIMYINYVGLLKILYSPNILSSYQLANRFVEWINNVFFASETKSVKPKIDTVVKSTDTHHNNVECSRTNYTTIITNLRSQLLEKDKELMQKDYQLLQKECELLKKDNQLLRTQVNTN